jgi:hypothetical protein
MQRIISTVLFAALCSTGIAVHAQDKTRAEPSGQEKVAKDPMAKPAPMGMGAGARSPMDTNGDGMVSREEFMAHHEAAWNKMKKNAKGMVMNADMPGMPKVGDDTPHANPK